VLVTPALRVRSRANLCTMAEAHRRTVLVVGASGVIGQAAAAEFASQSRWDVHGVSRRVPADLPGVTLHHVDLLDRPSCLSVLGALPAVTHVVYAAVDEAPGLVAGWFDPASIARNETMLRNVLDGLDGAGGALQHVTLLQGSKAYGVHSPDPAVAAAPLPLRERDPLRPHANFYFAQEDLLRSRQGAGGWSVALLRPTVVYGGALGTNMNLIPVIGAYATLLRAAGRPLHFPKQLGSPFLSEAVDARLLARAIVWSCESPQARDEVFNVTNGDAFAWRVVWPSIAEAFGMAPGDPAPISFADWMPAQGTAWAGLVEDHGLRAPADIMAFVGPNSLVYADMLLREDPAPRTPILNSTVKIRQAGFADCMDSEDMFVEWFTLLQESGVLPRRPV
jgi:nucleoside-diphosphate-sugar epimerase